MKKSTAVSSPTQESCSKRRSLIMKKKKKKKKKGRRKTYSAPIGGFGSCSVLKRCKQQLSEKEKQVLPIMTKEKSETGHPSTTTTSITTLKKRSRHIMPGDTVNISDLLFTQKRDYLIKNDGHVVKAHQLKGKVVLIYMVSLSLYLPREYNYKLMDLVETYNLLSDRGCFEVVFVATRDYDDPYLKKDFELEFWLAKHPQDRFMNLFCSMPWSAVPFSDKECRENIDTRLNLSDKLFPFFIIVQPDGRVSSADDGYIIKNFGAEGFPWTYECIRNLDSQDTAAFRHPSLKTLLASIDRNFLTSGDMHQVPISKLEHKVVGLYFYIDGEHEKLTEKLKLAYQELVARGEDFEVVLINVNLSLDYTRLNLESFWENIRGMPWLALPFMDPNIRKVRRIFFNYNSYRHETPNGMLVIIGPNGSYKEIYAADIFERYGIEAYPFTRKKAAQVEAAKLRKLKLNSLLDPGVVLRRGKDEGLIPLWELADKRVLLLFAVKLCFKSNEFVYANKKTSSKFLSMLKRKYMLHKGKEDEFEVIYISFDCEEPTYSESVAEMPWLVHPFRKDMADKMVKCIFKEIPWSALVAFQDGTLLTKSRNVLSRKMRHNDFPFVADLEKKTLKELEEAYNWSGCII